MVVRRRSTYCDDNDAEDVEKSQWSPTSECVPEGVPWVGDTGGPFTQDREDSEGTWQDREDAQDSRWRNGTWQDYDWRDWQSREPETQDEAFWAGFAGGLFFASLFWIILWFKFA